MVSLLRLVEVNKDNIWEILRLTVTDEQKNFIATNAVSVAQSKVQPECIPLGVYEDKNHHITYISFEPENLVAKELYESMGFVADGRIEGGEIVYCLKY